MPRADRIRAVLDHVFGAPSVSSRERNRDVLRILAAKLDEYLNIRKVENAESAVHSLPIDMASGLAPDFTLMDPEQRINEWQSEKYYNQDYMQEMTPTTTDDWWSYQTQYAVAEHPMSRNMWTEDFGMNPGMV